MAIRKKLRYKKKAMAGERLYLAKVLATDTSRRGRPEIETKCSKYYMEKATINNYAYKKLTASVMFTLIFASTGNVFS